MTEEIDYEPPPFAPAGDGMDQQADVFSQPDALADQPVPRITISAFCELNETAVLVRDAATDRRMKDAHVHVETGGLAAAIERFHDEPTPNLVIVETGMRGRNLFEQLDELAAVCDADTKVVIIGAANDIALYRELMRRGVSEYLVPPLTAPNLMRAIAALYADPDEPFYGRTIAFVGGKGGVGSSTLAHNIAWCISEGARIDTTLVDLDLPFGTASLDFNQDAPQGVGDALSQPERVDNVLLDRLVTKCTEHLTLFSAPANLDSEWDVDAHAYATVIDAIRKTVPVVALDLPHVWTPWMRDVLLSADDVIITATPELSSLRNTKNLYEILTSAKPNDPPPRVILNQVGVPKRPEIPVKEFTSALGARVDMVVPFEPTLFGAAANNGQMIFEVKSDAKPSEAIRNFALGLVGRTMVARQTGLISKFMGRAR